MNSEKITTLGLDLGTNSLGWCLLETNGEPGAGPEGNIIALGARIFSSAEMAGRDAKTKASLAIERRNARSMRRRRDRYLARRAKLLNRLTGFGLMPARKDERKALVDAVQDHKGGDQTGAIYGLRARALKEPLQPYEIGRVLFHLNQRRGFKSNRKADKGDNEAGKIAVGAERAYHAMQEMGAATFGEMMHLRRLKGETVRARLRPEAEWNNGLDADGKPLKGDGYDFYPTRGELEREFDLICKEQARHHPRLLTTEVIAQLREVIFYQRPLKPVEAGQCAYNAAEKRAPKAHPLFQRFRLYKEINELALINKEEGKSSKGRKLTREERDILILAMRDKKSSSFAQLRKALRLGSEYQFNKETANRAKLEGDLLEAELAQEECFGPGWRKLSLADQARIAEKLRTEEDFTKLIQWLRQEFHLDEERARKVAAVHVSDGYGRLGESALSALLDELINTTDDNGHVITESAAAIRVYGRTNSERDPDDPAHDLLPKYQEVLQKHIIPGDSPGAEIAFDDPQYDEKKGRITNPTVHIALNQLRRVVNAIILKHGKPDRISIELGRELKLSDKKRDEVNTEIGKNTKAAIERSKELKNLNITDNGYYRLRLKLWEELHENPLNRCCIYTGEPISKIDALSDTCEIDHILPYSRTMDDSQSNKILCLRAGNRNKGSNAPSEMKGWDIDAIRARAAHLPANKRWRFADDAMQRFEETQDFAARQLTDMQHASRMALKYLSYLYPAEEPDEHDPAEEADEHGKLRHRHVRALPGKMTEMLRRYWGLNDILHDHDFAQTVKPKNRKDHRHHAIDAAVIACTTQAIIQKLAAAARQAEERGAERKASKIAPPWPTFRDELRGKINAAIVSHKPDRGTARPDQSHQTAGQLHKDTAYGPTDERDDKGNLQVVRRKALSAFEKTGDLDAIRDDYLRRTLQEITAGLEGKDFKQALLRFAGQTTFEGKKNPFFNLRHIRVLETEYPIWIEGKDGRTTRGGKPPKGYLAGSNHRFDVWELPPSGKGKFGHEKKWAADVVSKFDAHQSGYTSPIRAHYATARKIMSLHIGDMVAYNHPETGKRVIARVRKFDQSGKIYFDPHNEAGELDKRHKDPDDPFRSFGKLPNTMRPLQFRQIRIDELGDVWDPGPRR